MLLIVTNTTDLGADYIVHRLHQRGEPFVRLNTDEYPDRFEIRLRVSSGGSDFLVTFHDGRQVASEDVSGVIFRRPVVPPTSRDVLLEDASFVEREFLEVLRSLWRSIPEDRWLNHPANLWHARNKYEQLLRAVRFGLAIPETVVTSAPGDVERFGANVGWPIVCKAVKHGMVVSKGVARLGTTRVVEETDLPRIRSSARCPMILQKLVGKQCDLRITVVGSRVFAAAIDSQVHAETAIDWRAIHRLPHGSLPHRVYELPEDIAKRCLGLTRSYGLRFSAIDLALTLGGNYVFFELNPNGEWVWIEERLGLPICDAILDLLRAGDSGDE